MKNVHLCVAILVLLCLPSLSLSDEGEWSRKADMPTRRAWFSASAVNGKIYAIGGWYNGMTLSVVEEYDPITDMWTRKADMPTQRDGLSTIAVNGKIYAIGGLFEEAGLFLPTVEEYDPATDTWTRKADLSSARAEFSLSSIDGKIYISGGGNPKALDAVEEYDPVKDIWTKKADMPTPRCKLAKYAPVVNGKIYVMGGSEIYYPESGIFSTAEEYDPATDTWAKKTDMPTARWGLALDEVNGKIYAIGGERSSRTNFLRTVEEYDPAIDTWTTKADMPTGRCAFASAAVNGMIYAMGGLNQNGILSMVEAYDTGVREDTVPSLPWIHVIQPPPIEGSTMGGEPIAIFGEGFTSVINATIGGNPLTQMEVTDTLITGLAPPGVEGEWAIVLLTPRSDYSVFAGNFIYKTPSDVVVERITPTNGRLAGGDKASVTGSGFLPGATVTIGGVPATNVGVTPTVVAFTIPPGTGGAKDVVVTNPDGQEAVKEDGFSYNLPPRIFSVSPNAGPLEGGTPIAITGTGFMGMLDVLIGDAEASIGKRILPTKITALTTPSTPGVKDVTVRNPDGQRATRQDAFTYNTAPVITRVTPDNGRLAGGTRITIQGGGFQPGAEVRISISQGAYRPASSVEVMSSSIITALTPPGQPGAENVLVLNPDMQIAIRSEGYTYNPIPTITRLIPNHGPSSGGSTITIEGTGFLLGARVVIGERAATTMVRDDMTIEAVAPPNPH